MRKTYKTYIYGSAAWLVVSQSICRGDDREYEQLRTGAEAPGAAYQKVNFLRDVVADHETLGRVYFPKCRLIWRLMNPPSRLLSMILS